MSSQPRILLADDDPILAQTLSEHLAASGFAVTVAADAAEALRDAKGQDAVVLNDRMPDAPRLCRELAAEGARVLILGEALAGAAASVPKPLRLGALLARLGDLARQPAPGPRTIRFGPWQMTEGTRQLVHDTGGSVRLTDKESAILGFLAQAAGVVARERLLAEVWGYSAAVTTHTLETHIYRLRRKIEEDPANALLLVTEDGGYRLVTGA